MAETGEAEAVEEAEPAFETGAAAMAAALDEARDDPSLREHVAAFFEAQRGLIEAQKHHLHIQLRQLHLRTFGDGLKLAFQAVSVIAVLALTTAVGFIVRDAMNDHGLVIESFTAPADLGARGLTGQALAEDLLGRIAAIRRQANANSVTESDDVRAGGADALKVEIPQTGISLDEIDRFLHSRLGQARQLSGEIEELSDGRVSIDLYLSQSDPIMVEGSAADFDKLMQQAAEKAFAAFDPVNYVLYLGSLGRSEEMLAAADLNVQNAKNSFDLANALSLASESDGDPHRGLLKAYAGVKADPKLWDVWSAASTNSAELGHDQDALASSRREIAVRSQDQWRNHRAALPLIFRRVRVRIDEALGDFQAARLELAMIIPGADLTNGANHRESVTAAARQHDCGGAAQESVLAETLGKVSPIQATFARWKIAVCKSDWRGALAEADALFAADQKAQTVVDKNTASRIAASLQTEDTPHLAYARTMTGDLAGAAALIATTPLDCYLCIRTRGQVAAAAHDWAGANRWFAEAVRQAPDLPFAYDEWGEMFAAKGDLETAEANLSTAAAKAPHYPDPLKAWGDVLAREGRWKAAVGKYDEALKYAPAWAELHQARDAAARKG